MLKFSQNNRNFLIYLSSKLMFLLLLWLPEGKLLSQMDHSYGMPLVSGAVH